MLALETVRWSDATAWCSIWACWGCWTWARKGSEMMKRCNRHRKHIEQTYRKGECNCIRIAPRSEESYVTREERFIIVDRNRRKGRMKFGTALVRCLLRIRGVDWKELDEIWREIFSFGFIRFLIRTSVLMSRLKRYEQPKYQMRSRCWEFCFTSLLQSP